MTKEEGQICAYMPIISALFPGINYFSVTGFHQVMKDLITPVIKKRFPTLATLPENDVGAEEQVEIKECMPANGYEWSDSEKWKNKFKKLLAA